MRAKFDNRIDAAFRRLRARGEKAAILFVTAGDPSLAVTRQFLRFAEESGVDVVELGVPFSDPIADGPVIQASSYRALLRGVNYDKILKLVREERRAGLRVPIALMSSFNPLYRYGTRKALAAAKIAGVDGFIVPDLPVHEAGEFMRCAEDYGLHEILMATPTTAPARMERICAKARGFIYYVSITGVTGERARTTYEFRADVERLRRRTRVPVCVGFGVSTPEQAREIAAFSDGVIVGSALVRDMDLHSKKSLSPATRRLISGIVRGVKSARPPRPKGAAR